MAKAKRIPVRVGFRANTDPDVAYRWTVECEYPKNAIEISQFIDSETAYTFAMAQMRLIKPAPPA